MTNEFRIGVFCNVQIKIKINSVHNNNNNNDDYIEILCVFISTLPAVAIVIAHEQGNAMLVKSCFQMLYELLVVHIKGKNVF